MRRVISSLTLMDDVFFSRCFSENIKCTALLLRIILGREDLEVVETRTQEWMQSIANHSVRLDIFARDKKGNIYDIEIQNVQAGNSFRRARYYSAMMDTRSLGKGEDYEKLPESFVIFITQGDAIGDGKALYTIERMVRETGHSFSDGTHIVFVSASLAEKDTALGCLMHDMMCADPKRMHFTELRDVVSYYKEDLEGEAKMSSEFELLIQKYLRKGEEEGHKKGLEQGMKEGIREGLKEGKREGMREGMREGIKKGSFTTSMQIARNMIADGSIPLNKIAEFSGLPLGEVESIRRSLNG